MKIGVILGSTREGRIGESSAKWAYSQAKERETEVEYELIDLKEFDLPFFTGPVPPNSMEKKYSDPKVVAWSEKIDSLDGFIFVTAEYNRSIPAPFKNAFDTLASEWREKPVGFVGYGYGSGGNGSVGTWRTVVTPMKMDAVEQHVSISLRNELVDGEFTPADGQAVTLGTVLDKLESAVSA